MRIPIAVQLALLVLLTAVSGVAVLAIATWFTTYDFVVGVESQGLELVATIKASQIASNLDLIETTCKTIATRILIQSALKRYYAGNNTVENWTNSIADVQSALGSRGYLSLYQSIIYSKNGEEGIETLLNVTSDSVPDITLPYTYPNGSSVMLGDDGLGYPPSLYPNLTYRAGDNGSAAVYAFSDYILGLDSALLLGPLKVNSSFSLVSLTLPIVNNTSNTDMMGFMTVVASAASLQSVVSSRDGLGTSGQVLLIGPSRPANTFASAEQPATSTSVAHTEALDKAQVHYVFEPTPLPTQASRHTGMSTDTPFVLSTYPIALRVMLQSYRNVNNAISDLSTRNELGVSVAVGAVRPQNSLVEWILLVEETRSEAFAPVARLRKIILACVFGTAGAIILLVPLLTHWAVAPIRRLRAAAQKSVEPDIAHHPAPESGGTEFDIDDAQGESVERIEEHMNEKGSPAMWVKRLRRPLGRLNSSISTGNSKNIRGFQIPRRVKERKHCITDELTDLTKTYNAMSDELTIQYTRLEERVAERTRELEKAKLTAETANESKTLFIANISHELKTPLNGILGMCAVCMGEDDLSRIKKSLQVVYQSGDLLLHLLNDLLTFSKNQIDQAIQIEEKEFKLSDVRSQLAIIFQNQVHEKQIDFSVKFVSRGITEPQGTVCRENGLEHPLFSLAQPSRLADMVLWGDQHRILQVLINLVSNSLKFTPEKGKVEVRIRLVDETPGVDSHLPLKDTPRRLSQLRSRTGSSASSSIPPTASVNEGQSDAQRTAKPNLRQVTFQFEVQDNGPGIPAHLHRRIFDPFVQGDLGLNRKYGGTGLGLSICAQLSHIMGGVILLDSEESKGSLFTLRIPLGYVKELVPSAHTGSIPGSRTPSVLSLEDFSIAARTPSNHGSVRNEPHAPGFEKSEIQPRLVGLSQPFFTPTVPSSPSPVTNNSSNHSSLDKGDGSKKIRVLVAEDNTVNQEVVRRMLALEEVYDVTIVKDGQEAYDTVKSNMEKGEVFDLIFMDIQMPILDGLQSTRLIRQMGYSAPIVALSAFAEESNIKDCLDCGMDMFISKPIRRPALKHVLSKFSTILEEAENGS